MLENIFISIGFTLCSFALLAIGSFVIAFFYLRAVKFYAKARAIMMIVDIEKKLDVQDKFALEAMIKKYLKHNNK